MAVTGDIRDQQIEAFLTRHGWGNGIRQKIQGDASFRRYERIVRPEGYHTPEHVILMDAPPSHENVRPFVKVDSLFREGGVNAPAIYAADEENGLLLLEDLGVDSFSLVLAGVSRVNTTNSAEKDLYTVAIDALTCIQQISPPSWLPMYDNALFLRELSLFTDWYMKQFRSMDIAEAEVARFTMLWEEVFHHVHLLPKVCIHRDYHADNLFWLPERKTIARVGILDFQDAVTGCPAYDMVSLLEDARRDVSPDTVYTVIDHYLKNNTHLDRDAFMTAYAIMGAQRNLKIIGIFARLAIRDKKTRYLDFLPRVWNHLRHDLTHPILSDIHEWLERAVPDDIRAQGFSSVKSAISENRASE
ncbi:MAG: phosphotransferase [Rickettsiales bacterium]|jgi:aminoglycoside/choline kinase family phosphotransferase|nr:phosphotransferase [Rickettsiales bacterium]